ncbi:hypothetical protein KEM55_001607 [Ascosphaera atra]|nr:hypothetical protein KEM55_001607 [Ascosphaera atra]
MSLSLMTQNALRNWQQRVQRASSLPEHAGTRDVLPVTRCRERDGGCILTRARVADAAHIYPLSLSGARVAGSPEENFWELIKLLWRPEQLTSWYEALFDRRGNYNDSCINMMMLNPLAHRYHSRGYFGLRPLHINADETELKVEFRWLNQGVAREPYSSFPDIFAPLPNGRTYGPDNSMLAHHGDRHFVRSGEVITFTTTDKKRRPLPSWEILQLQWVMQCISAMCGAAEAMDREDGPFDDNFAGSAEGIEQSYMCN